jgi:hypothetical protein
LIFSRKDDEMDILFGCCGGLILLAGPWIIYFFMRSNHQRGMSSEEKRENDEPGFGG